MKRITTLLLAAAMLLGVVSQAAAMDVTDSGQMVFQFGFRDNFGNYGANRFTDAEQDHFFARQRFRVQTEFVASENLKGVLQLQFGVSNWGNAAEGGQLDTNANNGLVRQSYIDWKVAETDLSIKMGLQLLILPWATSGTPVLDTTVAAIVGSKKFTDNVTMSAFWARPYSNPNAEELKNNQMDLFAVLGDFNYGTVRVQPYFMYGRIGEASGWGGTGATDWHQGNMNGSSDGDEYSNLYLGAAALTVKPVDNLTVTFDGLYGSMKSEVDSFTAGFDESTGYMVVLGADYDMGFMTPGFVAWYASGDDKDDYDKGEMGTLPTISQGNSGFKPTRLGTSGFYMMGDGSLITTTGTGTWGAGVHLKNISFVENLKHVVRAFYYQGTNDKDLYAVDRSFYNNNLYLTEEDNAFEIDFDSVYSYHKNLRFHLETGYIHMDWYKKEERGFNKNSVWNTQLLVEYTF